jgi:hypothetical protein
MTAPASAVQKLQKNLANGAPSTHDPAAEFETYGGQKAGMREAKPLVKPYRGEVGAIADNRDHAPVAPLLAGRKMPRPATSGWR